MLFGKRVNVMVVSPDRKIQDTLGNLLANCGVVAIAASSIKDAKSILDQDCVTAILSSDELPDGEIREMLQGSDGGPSPLPVVVFSRLADWKYYLNVVHAGAFDCVLYPPERGEIERVVLHALKSAGGDQRVHRAAAG